MSEFIQELCKAGLSCEFIDNLSNRMDIRLALD